MIKVILHTTDKKFDSIEIFAPHEKDYPMAVLDLPLHPDEQGFMLSFDGANDWYMGDDKEAMDWRIKCILLARAIATAGEPLKHATDFAIQCSAIECAYYATFTDKDIMVLHRWEQ